MAKRTNAYVIESRIVFLKVVSPCKLVRLYVALKMRHADSDGHALIFVLLDLESRYIARSKRKDGMFMFVPP